MCFHSNIIQHIIQWIRIINKMEKTASGSENKNFFVITPSKNGECFVVTTLTKNAWEMFYKHLKDQYTFQLNGNGNTTTTTSVEGQKVALTLYNTSQKLLIQGLGCRLWKDTVLKELSNKVITAISISPTIQAATDIESHKECEEIIPNSRPVQPKVAENKSSGNILSKLFGIKKMPKSPSTPVNYMGLTKEEQYDYMRQNYPKYHKKMPKTPSTPVNYMGLTKEEQYEYVRQRDPKYHLKTPRNYSPINTSISNFANNSDKSPICSQNTNKDVIPTAIDGAPINTSKCLSELNDETVECLSLSETESVSFTTTNLEQSKCIGEDKQLAEPQELPEYHQKPKEMDQGKTEENYIRELEMCQRELSTLKKENTELRHKFKEFLTQSKLLRDENEKLIQDTESQKEKCKEVLENLGQEAEKCEQYRTNIKSVTEHYESEIKALTGKLADETALALT